MKNIKIIIILALIIVLPNLLSGQSIDDATKKGMAAITESALKGQLSFLASNWMEGRETGEKGEYISADYIASMLQLYGLEPGGDYAGMSQGGGRTRTYFQTFQLLKSSPGTSQSMSVTSSSTTGSKTVHFTYNVDYSFRNTSSSMEFDAPVVFVGYGIKSDKYKYNDFVKKDVKGKIILRIAGVPSSLRVQAGTEATAIAASKDETARELGVAGIIEVSPDAVVLASGAEQKEFLNMSPSEGRPRSGNPPASMSIPSPSIPATVPKITASLRVANEILRDGGFTIADYIKADGAKPAVVFPEVVGKKMNLVSSVNTSLINVRNVIGVIEGVNKNEVLVVAGHYDHMGIGNGYIWNGADDNGSGTVAVMTIARAVMATGVKPQKTIVFALWTAEEKGLLGSKYWVDNPTVPFESIKMNINFDMVSRYITDQSPDSVTMTYTSSHELFMQITEKNLVKYNIRLKPDYVSSPSPTGGSDHRSFVAKGIPIMRFKPGHREEYHTIADETSTVDWDIFEKVVKISFANLWELANTNWK